MPKPKLAVFKFASCDGCQLSLLDAEDELLAITNAVEMAYFLEARTQEIPGPYDVGLVEGSITTAHDAERIKQIRQPVPVPGHHRRLCHLGRYPGAEELGQRRPTTSTPSTPSPNTSARWPPAPRSATTSGSTSSCAAAPSTRTN